MNASKIIFATAAAVLITASTQAIAEHKHGDGAMKMDMTGAEVTMHRISEKGVGEAVGTITLMDGPYGLIVVPHLMGVPTGAHATHVHDKPNCGTSSKDGKVTVGGGAGGHYDPKHAGQYLGPYLEGALGDMPNLYAEADGSVTIPVVAPRLKLADVRGRSLMMHGGADRYQAVAGHGGGHGHGHAGHMHGGGRILCGVVP